MNDGSSPTVAIVDYGMGNLFSVKHACSYVGLRALITSSPHEIERSDAVILPGIGAFGDAMQILRKLDLVVVLRDLAQSSRPLVGICLGMQLLMSESFEFGRHEGLGIIPGSVVRLPNSVGGEGKIKVPQVGWNRLFRPSSPYDGDPWAHSHLRGLQDGVLMYFVHSYYVKPDDSSIVLATTRYGALEFCSAFARGGNVFGCQPHPERSGTAGLTVYRNLANLLFRPERLLTDNKLAT